MSTLRRFVTPLAILAALVLAYLANPWLRPPDSIAPILSVVFWILAILVIVGLFQDRHNPGAEVVEVEGPAFTRYLFNNTRAGLFWLPIRLFVGFAWLSSGLGKLLPEGKPMGAGWLDGGSALLAYWERAVAIPDAPARPAITYDWYRGFLQILIDNDAQAWFAYLIVLGELLVGVGLIVGALVGFAAFFGALMNMSFLLAGSASTNPVLFTMAIGLILAWRVAGYYGLDRYLLPLLGVPWRAPVASPDATEIRRAPS
ncbi:MAG: DoxX family membrane protein [Chloroflexi bacterium]|nr:DoxX family membrane protein [Chloroflexota bacterium]